MSDRHKYAFNGERRFEVVQELMEQDVFYDFPIGTIGGIDGWFLKMQRMIINNEVNYYPFICTRERKTMLMIRKYLNIRKNDGSSDSPRYCSSYMIPGFGASGTRRPMAEWLNEKNGFVTNGGIAIEYGFQIEGILNENDIWTFNFHDPLFDCDTKKNMITFEKYHDSQKNFFYCHKQLLTFHSSYFDSDSKDNLSEERYNSTRNFNTFLQIAHGVRRKVRMNTVHKVLIEARDYKMPNVVKLIDQDLCLDTSDDKLLISTTIKYKLHHYLARLLKERGSSEGLSKELKNVDLETVSRETMKKLVHFFLYN